MGVRLERKRLARERYSITKIRARHVQVQSFFQYLYPILKQVENCNLNLQVFKPALHIPVFHFCANRILKVSCSFDIKKILCLLGSYCRLLLSSIIHIFTVFLNIDASYFLYLFWPFLCICRPFFPGLKYDYAYKTESTGLSRHRVHWEFVFQNVFHKWKMRNFA